MFAKAAAVSHCCVLGCVVCCVLGCVVLCCVVLCTSIIVVESCVACVVCSCVQMCMYVLYMCLLPGNRLRFGTFQYIHVVLPGQVPGTW
jgi:hypothetical protein